MKHPYGIGLDIGIASVGWAVVALNENAEPYGLIRCGSRIFDSFLFFTSDMALPLLVLFCKKWSGRTDIPDILI